MSEPITTPQPAQQPPTPDPQSSQVPIPVDQLKTPAPEVDKKTEVSEIQAKLRQKFKEQLKSSSPEPKSESKIVEPEKEKKTKEEKKADEPPKEEKKKVKVTQKPKSNEDDLVRAAADSAAAARAAVEMVSKKTTEAPVPKKSELESKIEALPEALKENIPIFKAMEEKWPDKYKGISDKYLKSAIKTAEYTKSWEKENPGQTFDAKDEQHSSFFEENEVNWEERDYARAIAAIESGQAVAEERKKSDEKIRALEARNTVQELEPAIRTKQSSMAREILKDLTPQLEDLVTDEARINEKALAKLKEEDPFTADAVLSELAPLALFVRETEKLLHPSGLFHYDESNPIHLAILNFWSDQEKRIKGSDQERDEKGRKFLSMPEWNNTPDNLKDRYWTLDKDQLIELRKESAHTELKKKLEDLTQRIEKTAKFKGFIKNDAPPVANGEVKEEKAEPNESSKKPSGPSAAGEIKTDTLAGKSTNTPTDFRSILKAKLRGASIR